MERNPEVDIEYQSLVDNPNERGFQVILTETQLRVSIFALSIRTAV